MFIKEIKYMEEVNSTASDVHDNIENFLSERFNTEIKFNGKHSDIIWNAIQEVLEDYSETGDYRNHN